MIEGLTDLGIAAPLAFDIATIVVPMMVAPGVSMRISGLEVKLVPSNFGC